MMEFTHECKVVLTYKSQINVVDHINRIKDRNHTITSVDTEKALNKSQHIFVLFIIKNIEQRRNRRGLLQPNRVIYVKLKALHRT